MKVNLDSTSLREMRRRAGLSQLQVALSLGRTQGWLSNIELGYVTPSPEVARKLRASIKRIASDSDS